MRIMSLSMLDTYDVRSLVISLKIRLFIGHSPVHVLYVLNFLDCYHSAIGLLAGTFGIYCEHSIITLVDFNL